MHQWGANPTADWYPWLQQALVAKGFTVVVPEMPEADAPKIAAWVTALAQAIRTPDENTLLVGHSVGCQTIWRYLETVPAGQKVGGVVCVAGWLTLKNLSEEEQPVARPWLETPINFQSVKQHTSNITAVFSDDDPWVPVDNQAAFEKNLGAKTLLLSGRGHFSADQGITQVPEVLDAILELAG